MSKYRFERGILLPDCFPCCGGQGCCPNEAVCVVAIDCVRCRVPVTQRRFYCKRCLIKFVARNCCEDFDLPAWVIPLVMVGHENCSSQSQVSSVSFADSVKTAAKVVRQSEARR